MVYGVVWYFYESGSIVRHGLVRYLYERCGIVCCGMVSILYSLFAVPSRDPGKYPLASCTPAHPGQNSNSYALMSVRGSSFTPRDLLCLSSLIPLCPLPATFCSSLKTIIFSWG